MTLPRAESKPWIPGEFLRAIAGCPSPIEAIGLGCSDPEARIPVLTGAMMIKPFSPGIKGAVASALSLDPPCAFIRLVEILFSVYHLVHLSFGIFCGHPGRLYSY